MYVPRKNKNIENLVGYKFSKLLVLEFSHTNRHNKSCWRCLCDCGKVVVIVAGNLKSKISKSCGCSKIDDLSGKMFGKLTVIDLHHRIKKRLYRRCLCLCGNETVIYSNSLKCGDTKSCGCASYSEEVQEKTKQTWLKKYGVDSPMKNWEIKEKRKQTCLDKCGVSSPMKNKDVQEKTKKTNIERYGFSCSLQNKEIAFKNAKAQNNSFVLFHWKTNEEVICRASYEKKVVEWLNNNQIDFDFQVPFDMPDGRRYFVDLYLKDRDLWVEVKGWFRGDAKEKWDWFHNEYPNSELWNKERLKEMKIL